jgi:hypothetical protein
VTRANNAGTREINMKSFRNARFLGAIAMVLGIAVNGMVVSSAAQTGASDSKVHDAATVARARASFLKSMSSRRPMVRSNVAPLLSNGGATSLPSANWTGFADIEAGSKTVSSVTGQWVIPNVECPSGLYKYQDAFIAQWIGVDGATDGTVEQLGSATQCFEGVTYYYVWYEMYPAGTIEEGTVACINNNVNCPEPGDRISAAITVTPTGNYRLSLLDLTRPQESFSVTASCDPSTCLDSSAEWIVERPAAEGSLGAQILPLVDFFRTSFANATVTSGGKPSYIEGFQDGPVYNIAMVDDFDAYFLACVAQGEYGPQLLQVGAANACPTVPASRGGFPVTWYNGF